MAIFRAGLSTWQKAVVVAALVLLFGGFAAMVAGEFGTSVGSAGLANRAAANAGVFAMGLAMLGFTAVFAAGDWRARPRSLEAWKQEAREGTRELGAALINIIGYGGTVLLALGALTVVDSVPVASVVIILVCIAGFVALRRWRKRHPRTYPRANGAAMFLFMVGFGCVACTVGAFEGAKAAADALEGPRTALCAIVSFEEQRPTGRYRALSTTDLALELADDEGRTVHISVKEQDREALRPLVEASGVAHTTFYPRTGILAAFDQQTAAREAWQE